MRLKTIRAMRAAGEQKKNAPEERVRSPQTEVSRPAEMIDYEKLAAAIAAALDGTAVQMDGHAVGVLVTGTVSKEIAREAKRRG